MHPEDKHVIPTENSKRHSFVIRIWIEETDLETLKPKWRGIITHVLSNKQLHIKGFLDIISFMAPYLKDMGIKIKLPVRILLKWKGKEAE